MKRRSVLFSELMRSIRRSMGRFLSILLIVALGCGFFAGLKVFSRDLTQTAARYYQESALMDYRLLCTYGITEEDVLALRGIEDVDAVMPSYTQDGYINYGTDDERVMRINGSAGGELNRLRVLEGRMPETADECVIDISRQNPENFRIGEKITFTVPAGEESMLTGSSYTIVGLVDSPMYINYERGSTSISDGSLDGMAYVLPEAFSADHYTEVYIRLKGTESLDCYDDVYDARIDQFEHILKHYTEERAEQRYEELSQEIEKAIAEGETRLSLGKAELETYSHRLDAMKEAARTGQMGSPATYLPMIETAERKLREAQSIYDAGVKQLDEARATLSSLRVPEWYIFDRSDNPGYSDLRDDGQRVDNIAKILPVFFIMIAMLVCLTSMTRMVDEERLQIGTLKALGIGSGTIACKYIAYAAVPTILGGIIGSAIGFKVFPIVLNIAYGLLYRVPAIETPFHWDYFLGCTLVALAATMLATVSACIHVLREQPAQLMRPKAGKSGSATVFERIPFLWKRLRFMQKITVRNLLRYKKRVFMTIAGIGGCTALMLTGFALKGAIQNIAPLQFDELFIYDAAAMVEENLSSDEYAEIQHSIAHDDAIADAMFVMQKTVDLHHEDVTKSVTMVVPQTPESLRQYVVLRSRANHSPISLPEDGVVISEKAARMLGVSVGDNLTASFGMDTTVTMRVSAITENYALHYVYLSPAYYASVCAASPEYNTLLANGSGEEGFGEALLEIDHIKAVKISAETRLTFFDMINNLNYIVLVIIVSAGLLAFIVLYNLSNINIAERTREIATIKVLGFRHGETASYIYRESMICTMIGILLGWVGGIALEHYVVRTAEVDAVMFIPTIGFSNFLISGLLTLIFTLAVGALMYIKIRRIDMVENLKSVE